MIRAILDPGVFISAVIAKGGPPDQIVRAWRRNRLEVIASPLLLEELERVLLRPKFRRYIEPAEVAELVDRVRRRATLVDDPPSPPAVTRDRGDDYLVALARAADATLVSGDRDLLDANVADIEVVSPRTLLERLMS